MTLLWVVLGAAVGAPLRYLTTRALQSPTGPAFPWGTWIVNVTGSFVLGLLAAGLGGGAVSPGLMAGLGAGFSGALTTYSTFAYETVRLFAAGARWRAFHNVVTSLVAGFAAALGGAAIAMAVWP